MSTLSDVLDRIAKWPDDARLELVNIALEMDAEINRKTYVPTPAELAGIDRGIAAATRGSMISLVEVERLFDKRRPG